MTWVTRVPPVGEAGVTTTYTNYFTLHDSRVLRWYGGKTEADARAEAEKTMRVDRKNKVYRFRSVCIVRTDMTDTVMEHIIP